MQLRPGSGRPATERVTARFRQAELARVRTSAESQQFAAVLSDQIASMLHGPDFVNHGFGQEIDSRRYTLKVLQHKWLGKIFLDHGCRLHAPAEGATKLDQCTGRAHYLFELE